MGASDFLLAFMPTIASILAGAGYAVVGLSPPEFRAARVFFLIAGALFITTGIMWGIQTSAPLWARILIVGLVGAISAAATNEAIRWVNARQKNSETSSAIEGRPIPTETVLSSPQEKLLGLLSEYQRHFATTRLIVSRENGRLYFDGDINRGKNVNLIIDLFGTDGEIERAKFRELIEDMPPSYMRLIPENRWGAPFVIRLTEEGRIYLKSNRIDVNLPKRPELDITNVFARSDRPESQFWYISLKNNGSIEARSLKLQLVGMDKSPRELLSWKGLYPYNVRPENVRGLLNWDGNSPILTPGESVVFELFETRISSDGRFRVVGMDANDVSKRNDTAVIFWPGEEWVLNYKATAINANPIQFRIYITFADGKFLVKNID